MNEKQVIQVQLIQHRLRDILNHLSEAMNTTNTSGQIPDALVHKSVELLVNVLADLQAYEREHFPDAKIVGLDFPTKRGVQFERTYEEPPF